ncbi:MAG: hypothetical protein H3C43_13885 [Leptonema sp. (in: Bacteria)]|nr:hypothetical protein [Leptonema sp. (in: bacteria)]
MNAEIAVQEKQRIVEETKMESIRIIEQKKKQVEQEKLIADIEIEKNKTELIKSSSQNLVEQAKAKTEAIRLEIEPLKQLSPELVEALLLGQLDSSRIVARAMRDLSKNADKIGNLNISPELLQSLIPQITNK